MRVSVKVALHNPGYLSPASKESSQKKSWLMLYKRAKNYDKYLAQEANRFQTRSLEEKPRANTWLLRLAPSLRDLFLENLGNLDEN